MNQPPKTEQNEYGFETEVTSLLHLLAHSLYSNPEIFLRELISNASDALAKRKFVSQTETSALGSEEVLQIDIEFDEKEKTFAIKDNGIGMDKTDLIQNLGTIAKSGTLQYVQTLKDGQDLQDFIGKFGVGFYSVFMVAQTVRVETAKLGDKVAYRWESDGKGTYRIEEIEYSGVGTKISFALKEDAHQFANQWKLEAIIKQYSDFVPYPIHINGKELVRRPALWSQPKKEIKSEQYKELYQYLSNTNDDYLFCYHYHLDAPQQFQAVIYVPQKRQQSMFQVEKEIQLQLYSRKVFIQDDCKALVPAWMRFLVGVVDSQDLPLNVSRQVVQDSPILSKINNFLVKRLIQEWKKLKKNDFEKFAHFYREFGFFIKEGIHADFQHKNELIELFHAQTSHSDGKLRSLAEYREAMPADQENIYYAVGQDKEAILSSPNMEAFIKKDIEVLFLYDEVDDFVLSVYNTYQEKKLVNIDSATIDIDENGQKTADNQPESKEQTAESQPASELDPAQKKLLEYCKDVLADKVADVIVSKRLVNSPCTLVVKQDGMTPQMEKMMRMMQPDFVPAKKILELNLRHPMILSMLEIHQSRPQDAVLKSTIFLLFDSCQMLENHLNSPMEVGKRLMESLTNLIDLQHTKLFKTAQDTEQTPNKSDGQNVEPTSADKESDAPKKMADEPADQQTDKNQS